MSRTSRYKLIKGEPALLVEDTLVVADLHIGYEGEVRLKGIVFPSLTEKMMERVLNLVKKHSIRKLLVVGDLKHTVHGPRGLEWRDVPVFMRRMVEELDWVGVVPGNHDGDLYAALPDGVELIDPDGIILNNILFTHGHKRVDLILEKKREENIIKTVVVGHFHPAVELVDDLGYRYVVPVWVKGMIGEDVEIILMPAFNENIGKLTVNNPGKISEELRGFLKTGSINLGGAEAYSLDLVLLGRVGDIQV
ncbi:MAG: metallophosphoesterase family protein [Candidatus Brockarchaeota archaeon]|nr:metallophosphoesterase family protein [Candidatus Brockarchaeota archaeon]